MENAYKYVLTRICLRTGQLTLPGSMVGLFPDEGIIEVQDAESGDIFLLTIDGPRHVGGLQDFFEQHKLDVNDEIHIQPKDVETYVFRAQKRSRKPDFRDPKTLVALLDELYEQATPLSEAELRSFYQAIPADVDVVAALKADRRFELKAGRWQAVSVAAPPVIPQPVAQDTVKPLLQDNMAGSSAHTKVTPYPQGKPLAGETGLNSESDTVDWEHHRFVKDTFAGLGYRVESLAQGQLLARAEMGRRKYSVFMHLLPEGEQLDWAALMAHRREAGATYAAVMGDHRDLLRLGAPAGLAKATLWSWSGLGRLDNLMTAMPISPYDLESHFERDGLFEHGLERFERAIGKRVSERGVFSSVLARLAGMKAPAIFMLDEAVDKGVPRDEALKVLELLASAPYHLIVKVDNGEFCLRYKVADALTQFSDYALTLRRYLPDRKHERIDASQAEIPVLNVGEAEAVGEQTS